MGDPPMPFAQQLRSLREAQGLTVRALAERVGVSKVTIWKWEKGESEPRARLLAPLARALDVNPARLTAGAVPGKALDVVLSEGGGPGEPLTDVIAKAKQMIAEAAGADPRNITISIEY